MRIRGKAFVLTRIQAAASAYQGADAEDARFRSALACVGDGLAILAKDSDIFAAHQEMLGDPMLADAVVEGIAGGLTATDAVWQACDGICAMFADIDDDYLKARTDDVRDICQRLVNALDGPALSANPFAGMEPGSVVVAEELFPSDAALMDFGKVVGIITAKGSATSHVCIISRNKGVPCLVGHDISVIRTGDMIDIEADHGDRGNVLQGVRAAIGDKPVAIYANAGSIDDVAAAVTAGMDGIGLLRTEFIFMTVDSMPSLQEQTAVYADAMRACKGRPLTIRTLDIGGDKSLPYLPMPHEDNPFLGQRGIRFCLAYPEIFQTQVRAILAAYAEVASEGRPLRLRVMFPMVNTVEELCRCKALVEAEAIGLGDGVTVGARSGGVAIGIMVETPAAVLGAAELASECDFFSIGTNDLTQYIMAADRGNDAVAGLYGLLPDAASRAVGMVVDAAHKAGITVGVCGEAASSPECARTLVALGVDSLSINSLN